MDQIHHPCVAGLLTDEMVKIVSQERGEYIANVDFLVGYGTKRETRIYGQVLLMEPTNYDVIAFALLREHYGLGFPQLLIVNYLGSLGHCTLQGGVQAVGMRFIMTRRFPDRELRREDYYPLSEENKAFRFQLCFLIYFSKFVGAGLSLSDVRVMDGVPFVWRCRSLGNKRAPTVSEEEFALLFGISPKDAGTIFHSVNHELLIDKTEEKDQSERRRIQFNSEAAKLQDIPDSQLFLDAVPNISYKDLKGTLFETVVNYFRAVNFDKDYIRECLLIRDNGVRNFKRNKRAFPLSKPTGDIAALLEENYATLSGAYPFNIFRM